MPDSGNDAYDPYGEATTSLVNRYLSMPMAPAVPAESYPNHMNTHPRTIPDSERAFATYNSHEQSDFNQRPYSLSASREPSVFNQRFGTFKAKWGVSPTDVCYHFGTSGMSVAAATGITHPLDNQAVSGGMQGRLSMRVVKTEGLRSLYLGLSPALMRSVLYGDLRLGLYEPSKYVCEMAFESTNVLMKIASGAFSGAVATALTNPVEVLKVRLQMNTKNSSGPIKELQKIASEEGVAGLWKGVGPAMARAGVLTAAQLATYDESKRVNASTIAGTVSTIMTAPIDMVKTRLMMQRESKRVGSYKNGLHCAYQGLCYFRKIGSSNNNYLYNLREVA
ncbi:hypothetical protein DH2020_024942 [Rehmannia glutinosa]|uniref:Uncharacterized protein n=1 Tax=Rehmannia glutinosa TaxID=99300 RepID=A0ABR0W134_REHGL